MSDTQSQLEEINALIAASPDDPSLLQLRDDLLQLIALEEQESSTATSAGHTETASDVANEGEPTGEYAAQINQGDASEQPEENSAYAAQGMFMEHMATSKESAIAEAPDLGTFQPVVSSSNSKSPSKVQINLKSDSSNGEAKGNLKDISATNDNNATTAAAAQPEKKKKKKKKKSDDDILEAKFELPSHLVPLESDKPAQKLKKQRTAKALKSKFRAKQKEVAHAKRANDWKSFATKAGGKRKKGVVAGGSSIFSTEEGVNARVGVISGSGARKMTDFADQNKRHKFT